MTDSLKSILSVNAIDLTFLLECLPLVWIELSMACLAAITYVMISRSRAAPPPSKVPPKSFPAEVPKQGTDPELTTSQLASKAMRQGKMKEAVALVRQLPGTQAGRVPANIAFRLLSAAAKGQKFGDAMSEMAALKGKMTNGPLEAAITESLKVGNLAACRRLHLLSNALLITKSHQTFQTLANAYAHDVVALRQLVQEAGMPLPRTFARTVLDACAAVKEVSLAADVLQKVTSADAELLRAGAAHASTSASQGTAEKINASSADCDISLESGGTNIPRDVSMRANDIRSCGRNGDLAGALKVFERLDQQTADHTLVMNSMVDACVACKDIEKALGYFTKARNNNLADTVTYNTMIKGYLADGQESAAKQVLAELSQKGLDTTRPSYHGLLNARINAGDSRGAWKLVADMQLSGISPNAVTCSILLKSKTQSPVEVNKVLALIDAMDQPMDEVLFLSVVEACIRTDRLDMLSRQMDKFKNQAGSTGLTAPTYGSMIKAFGHAHDTKQVWFLWRQMINNNVLPTSVTLGCMVESLVANGCPSDAWQLARDMLDDESTRPLVNTVIYSSILKGFASARETEKVMAVYEEMRARDIQPNTITYNTIMNAFASNGQMHRVPALLEDMRTAVPAVNPDIVTYSTIIKGFCNAGNLDRAFGVLKDMKAEGKCMPDEVLYNSLLSGCAKEFRADEALELVNDMRKSGIAPSNYTLSMLVKLMGRCKRLNQAFSILEDISTEYSLKINIQVYTCLIQGCFNNGQASRAIAVHEKIIKEGLYPDAMTYSVLVRGCLQAGIVDKAADMARYAHGKCDAAPAWIRSSPPGLNHGCLEEVITALGGPCNEQAKKLRVELGDSQPQWAPRTSLPQRGWGGSDRATRKW
jgi:pentatricopeptide repeat protein